MNAAAPANTPFDLALTVPPAHAPYLIAQAEVAPGHETAAPAEPHGTDAHAAPAEAHAGGHGEAHAAGHGEAHTFSSYMMPQEIPNLATLIQAGRGNMQPHGEARAHPSAAWFINPLFTLAICLTIVLFIRKAFSNPKIERPGFLQNMFEALLGGLRNFFIGVMGPGGAKFVPYICTIFLFIWINNLAGLLPFLKAPTSSFKTTFALGLTTFFYVHSSAIREGGLLNWLKHLRGDPWWLFPLNLPLHVMGELIKPVSLSLRLFGNIFGEDKLLAAFLGMGMMIVSLIMKTPTPIVGVPLHLPFFFLALLTCTLQALVFSLLASVYITLLLPHDSHDHDHAPVEDGKLVNEHGHVALHGQPSESPVAL